MCFLLQVNILATLAVRLSVFVGCYGDIDIPGESSRYVTCPSCGLQELQAYEFTSSCCPITTKSRLEVCNMSSECMLVVTRG